MNRDELDGKAQVIKGKFKKAVGDIANDDELKGEGAADEIVGKTKESLGKAERKVNDALDDLADKSDR